MVHAKFRPCREAPVSPAGRPTARTDALVLSDGGLSGCLSLRL